MDDWGKWLRENSDKFVLLVLFGLLVLLVVHMTHDAKDSDAILWARELAGTVLGALLGLITGHALASKATSTTASGGAAKVEIQQQ